MIKIGISACYFPPDPCRPIYKGKTLLYLGQPLSDWVLSEGALAYMIPSLPGNSLTQLGDFVADLDGLILQGGSDVSPETYGESAVKPEWGGDRIRDIYEIALFEEFCAQHKPVLGVCRGLQLLNVALGGTLYQDIHSQVEGAKELPNHRNWEIYDQNFHNITLTPGNYFSDLYAGETRRRVNSIHHQAIKDLAPKLEVLATSEPNLVEAVRLKSSEHFVVGVQWHPEFQQKNDTELLPSEPLLLDFLKCAKERSLR